MSGTAHLIIAGGGTSGTLLALHLLRSDVQKKFKITLAERSGSFGGGLAYGAHNKQHHLLNVRVKQLSCFADVPNDFHDYLLSTGRTVSANDFVPRVYFGEYLAQRLQQAVHESNGRLQLLTAEITAAQYTDSGVRCTLSAGGELHGTHLVLACGNLLPAPPAAAATVVSHAAYEKNPWHYDTFHGLDAAATVLLIGSGLTMADLVCELHSRGHRGKILSVSPHGFLPAQHQPPQMPWLPFGEQMLAAADLGTQLRIFRGQLREAEKRGIGWTAVTDSLRPWLQKLWLQGNDAWRNDFMQHVRHIWGVARHRLPPATAAVVYECIARGQLTVAAGRITSLEAKGDLITAQWKPRGKDTRQTIEAAKVINCTGPSSKWLSEGNALVKQMAAAGMLAYDRSALGLHATETGQLIDAAGNEQSGLFALGPMIRGVLWEITAVPEIRAQAAALAETLCT
ncbi:MAG: FAD/NAD(P)-binding protein [Bacteroidetes bacterium]|nr:FAD/NAD(P)-binding protein [Bacteroidota bacterium]